MLEKLSDRPYTRKELVESFGRLLNEKKIFGAELDPTLIKKSGGGGKFILKKTPPVRALVSTWVRIFGNRILPHEFFAAISRPIEGFLHDENALYFAKNKVIYDTRIFYSGETVGEMTLFFYTLTEGWKALTLFTRKPPTRVVYIETITLKKQASGYASALFRYYEALFKRIGFHQFRLKASLSVGKYYWAKEGFDFAEPDELGKKQEELKKFLREKNLPVEEEEVERLTHAYDFALFRRDLKVRIYRNREGYYSRARDGEFTEEAEFPLGKAFLLTSTPWDGFKVIYTDTPKKTGLVYSPRYLEHRTRRGQSEQAGRLTAVMKEVERNGMRQSLIFLSPYIPQEKVLQKVHTAEYLKSFREAVYRGERVFQTRDCSISRGSFTAALYAAGGVLAGIDAVMNRRVDNVFCLVRPPGHHAGRERAMGFCFLNNAAIGAVYARETYGVDRVFILDWDVHHGNGTQEIFEEDRSVFFCSIHEHPSFCYPGTGRRIETGKGDGEGYTLNIPLRPRATDRDFIRVVEEEVIPAMERFRPDLIIISAGFDAHEEDPIAHLSFTEHGFFEVTKKVLEAADALCGGRLVSILEGGYNIPSLKRSVVAHLSALQGREEICSSGGE
ncbi:MAG: histone deacetylase [Deltaproteobacteria bacterium]|nr:MAG: histone deacetylase [Deltaproteobacteria bacterium]